MGKNVFSVPIFFLVFRETLEAAIIVSVLLGLVEQIVRDGRSPIPSTNDRDLQNDGESDEVKKQRLLRKMRIQIFGGSALGLFIALAIGAAFVAIWFTQASNLWAKSEALWEGIFGLVASIIILVMAITMLKMDRAKAKWRLKLQRAFEGKATEGTAKTERWILFILPFITVLREGLEAVVFVGGVALGESATAIPLAAIIGIVCGLICGFIIYSFASRTTMTIFLIVTTNFLLLIGAGLFSKGIWELQVHSFNKLLGADVDDAGGDGPGSFDVRGNVWHLDCCNPNNHADRGWSIFAGIFGWTNSATLGSVLGYVFYWLTAIVILIYLKWKEGRTKLFGIESAAGRALREKRDARKVNHPKVSTAAGDDSNSEKNTDHSHEVTELPASGNY